MAAEQQEEQLLASPRLLGHWQGWKMRKIDVKENQG